MMKFKIDNGLEYIQKRIQTVISAKSSHKSAVFCFFFHEKVLLENLKNSYVRKECNFSFIMS